MFTRQHLKHWLGVVAHTFHPTMQGSTNRRIVIQGIKGDPISIITNAKMAGGVTQVIECLLGKCEVLSSNPNTAKKIKIE
jgi:hypothetical protein